MNAAINSHQLAQLTSAYIALEGEIKQLGEAATPGLRKVHYAMGLVLSELMPPMRRPVDPNRVAP